MLHEDDGAEKLSATDLRAILKKAVADYSKDRGLTIRKRITGDGTTSYSLAERLGSALRAGIHAHQPARIPCRVEPGGIPGRPPGDLRRRHGHRRLEPGPALPRAHAGADASLPSWRLPICST